MLEYSQMTDLLHSRALRITALPVQAGRYLHLAEAFSESRRLRSLLLARAKLSEIYGWLPEGFDTADLNDAKALLDDLSADVLDGALAVACGLVEGVAQASPSVPD